MDNYTSLANVSIFVNGMEITKREIFKVRPETLQIHAVRSYKLHPGHANAAFAVRCEVGQMTCRWVDATACAHKNIKHYGGGGKRTREIHKSSKHTLLESFRCDITIKLFWQMLQNLHAAFERTSSARKPPQQANHMLNAVNSFRNTLCWHLLLPWTF